MTQFIDRRLNSKKKSAVNRQRFIQRYKKQIKKAVSDAIAKRSITDIDKGEIINIPSKDITEPHFSLGEGGVVERVLPGNKQYIRGEHIEREEEGGGQGSGSESSNTGEGEDNFTFDLSREEFLDLYFEDLALPDLIKKDLAQVKTFESLRAGFVTSGSPANLSIPRSMLTAKSRRTALTGSYRKKLKLAEEELERLEGTPNEDLKIIDELRQKIIILKRKLNAIPFVDTTDLRYRNRIKLPRPSTQAVMFCIMDVSGSMDEIKKNVAKRFFILLYLFLTRTYEHIELVFIRHHTVAKEVNEEEFFYSRETGGTVVSSALELMDEIMRKRYPEEAWNIYAAQASDGDNWNADSPHCQDLLMKAIMPKVQYFAYIEIMPRHHQSLWESYVKIQETFPNFAMQNIESLTEIYPVFRELFKRKVPA
jgi:uncharacterized sporulation protein YeaH/YhbH (DUF444 family)